MSYWLMRSLNWMLLALLLGWGLWSGLERPDFTVRALELRPITSIHSLTLYNVFPVFVPCIVPHATPPPQSYTTKVMAPRRFNPGNSTNDSALPRSRGLTPRVKWSGTFAGGEGIPLGHFGMDFDEGFGVPSQSILERALTSSPPNFTRGSAWVHITRFGLGGPQLRMQGVEFPSQPSFLCKRATKEPGLSVRLRSGSGLIQRVITHTHGTHGHETPPHM